MTGFVRATGFFWVKSTDGLAGAEPVAPDAICDGSLAVAIGPEGVREVPHQPTTKPNPTTTTIRPKTAKILLNLDICFPVQQSGANPKDILSILRVQNNPFCP